MFPGAMQPQMPQMQMDPMMLGGGMPGGMGGGMPMQDPNGFYPAAETDPMTAMQQLPGMTPEMLMMMMQQAGNPLGMAEMGRLPQAQPSSNPLLAALMQMGAMPPQSM